MVWETANRFLGPKVNGLLLEDREVRMVMRQQASRRYRRYDLYRSNVLPCFTQVPAVQQDLILKGGEAQQPSWN